MRDISATCVTLDFLTRPSSCDSSRKIFVQFVQSCQLPLVSV